MGYDKAVDSAKLDADILSIADAIRAKGGTDAPLEFPQGFSDAVADIQTGGDGEWEQMTTELVEGKLDTFRSNATTIGFSFAFQRGRDGGWGKIRAFDFPEALTGTNGIKFDTIPAISFNFPKLESVKDNFFNRCGNVRFLDFPKLKVVPTYFVWHSDALDTLILRNPVLAPMGNVNALEFTKIAGGTGYVYVPKALVDQYKSAPNWSVYATQIRAIEDYPEITGGAK